MFPAVFKLLPNYCGIREDIGLAEIVL